MPSNSKFTKNDNGDTSVRVVSSTQSVVDTNQDSVFCKDEGGNVAIRVVTAQESLPAEQPDSMFTKDTHGNTAIRTVGGGGGSAPVIDELNVTPSTSAQTITAPEGTDGYSPVKVAAVTSAIDANISAGNIKKDVEILGVTGNYEGVAPSGTKQITTNGTHDVAGYANADVNVPTTAPAHYIEKTVDANGKLVNSTNLINLSGVTSIGEKVLANQYKDVSFPANTSVDMSSITTISEADACAGMFSNCSGITSVDLSGLITASGNGCVYGMFSECSSLTTLTLTNLTTVYDLAFFVKGCRNLKTISLPKLNVITVYLGTSYQEPFRDCVSLEDVYLGGLTSSTFSTLGKIGTIFNNTTGSQAPNGCTVHFPSNFDPSDPNHTFDASTLEGYPTFGGNASYIHVAFDLPATE